MYSLLVTAQKGAWANGNYEYDRSRFLEYTNENVASKFQELTPIHLDKLKKYPCIFAYEGDEEDIRIGKLKTLKLRGRKLFIEFEFDDEIPPIAFSDIKPIASLLDIRDWEMNRTHWALKDENLLERLSEASLIENSFQNTNMEGDDLPETPIERESLSSLQEFIGKILSIEKKNDVEVFYRGHSAKKRYKLEPSLFRRDQKGNYLYLNSEHILYRELIISNSSDFSSDTYTLDKLVRMQHYSLPTRLLDITSNPLIALYFACKSNHEEDGELIIFSINREDVKYFDSDVASCISNLARLPKKEKDKIDFYEEVAESQEQDEEKTEEQIKAEIEKFNKQDPIRRLTHFIKEEKSFFEPRIVKSDLRKVVCVKSKQSNDRISSQSGAFLLFGLDAVLDEQGTSDVNVDRLTVTNKIKILEELDLLNINESTVFPYIENSARYVAGKYEFNNSMQPTADAAAD